MERIRFEAVFALTCDWGGGGFILLFIGDGTTDGLLGTNFGYEGNTTTVLQVFKPRWSVVAIHLA